MFHCIEIQSLEDFFVDLSERKIQGVFFYRINGWNEQIREFLLKYYQTARSAGVVIEGRIPNPDEKNLAYYEEIMGMKFVLDENFIEKNLQKWLPRMNAFQRSNISKAMFDTLNQLKNAGKNENILKNAYIKFMCWYYYKFERVLSQLGKDKIPKILYEGSISHYELLFLQVLAKAGCDIVLLQYEGDADYLKLDPISKMSKELKVGEMKSFPKEFRLQTIRDEIQDKLNQQRLYGEKAVLCNATNIWIKGKGLDDIRMSLQMRGTENGFFYNAFLRINGVEDKITYVNELYQFYLELKNSGRKIVIIEKGIETPTIEEISQIKRNNYANYEQMFLDLQTNIKYTANIELQKIMVKSFVDILSEEAKAEGMNVNKMLNKAVYLLCWLKRYQEQLFFNWKESQVACFIYLGACQNNNEALFLRFLARLPVDVLLLNPNLNTKCMVSDKLLYEVPYKESLVLDKFPKENAGIQIGTTAYHAERELDVLMYQNSGIYRNQQYKKANIINLRTMYEEIAILWKQEMKYRPNFSVNETCVNLPVIYAKVCGVKDGNLINYWNGIKTLLTEDTLLIKEVPYIISTAPNPMKAFSTEFFKNGKLQRNKIKNHAKYPYGVLREEMQEYIFDKLQLMIDQRLIKGTFENGTEYTIVATVLNMKKEILRMIQKFDFTKINPKLVYINVTEESISLEDTILTVFLNLLGFDIVFFAPTGYQTVEKYLNQKQMDQHQIGGYLYDLRIPDFHMLPSTKPMSWKDKIFRKK